MTNATLVLRGSENPAMGGGRLRFVKWSGKWLQPLQWTVKADLGSASVLLQRLNPVLIDMDELWI